MYPDAADSFQPVNTQSTCSALPNSPMGQDGVIDYHEFVSWLYPSDALRSKALQEGCPVPIREPASPVRLRSSDRPGKAHQPTRAPLLVPPPHPPPRYALADLKARSSPSSQSQTVSQGILPGLPGNAPKWQIAKGKYNKLPKHKMSLMARSAKVKSLHIQSKGLGEQ